MAVGAGLDNLAGGVLLGTPGGAGALTRELYVELEYVVLLLGDQISGPPFDRLATVLLADLYNAFFGVHFEIVIDVVAVPVSALQTTLEPAANDDGADTPMAATDAGTATPRPITADSRIRRIKLIPSLCGRLLLQASMVRTPNPS